MPLQLVSLIAYHVSPEAPFSSAQLHAQQDLLTALNGTALLVGGRGLQRSGRCAWSGNSLADALASRLSRSNASVHSYASKAAP